MRDKRRIKRMLEKIETIWNMRTDERFFQMLINSKILPDGYYWNLEDDTIENGLDLEIKKIEAYIDSKETKD